MSKAETKIATIEKPQALQTMDHPVPAVADGSAALISMIERAARDPTVDMAKMERLFELHRSAEDRQWMRAYNASMAAAQAEMVQVVRTTTNAHTKSNYAAFDAVAAAITPIITKHGFGLSFSTGKSSLPNHMRLICEATHASGCCKTYESELPIDIAGINGSVNKTGIQAFGSTTTYGRRYMTMMIFNVATTDDNDGNKHVPPPALITGQQIETIEHRLANPIHNQAEFLSWLKAPSVARIKASQFSTAIAALDAREAAETVLPVPPSANKVPAVPAPPRAPPASTNLADPSGFLAKIEEVLGQAMTATELEEEWASFDATVETRMDKKDRVRAFAIYSRHENRLGRK